MKYNERYGTHDTTLSVRQLVKDLVDLMPDLGEKVIFHEAVKCLKYDAGRAAIIMVWNIAFYHLCLFVLKHHLRDFNSRIPIRYARKWRNADMPLSVLAFVSLPNDWNSPVHWIRIATLGAYHFAQRTSSERIDVSEDKVYLVVTPKELTYAQEHLAHDLASLIGAAFARESAEIAYRLVGKGAKFERPEPVPSDAWNLFDNYPSDGFIVMPSPTFVSNPALERAVRSYDERRWRCAIMGVGG